MGQNRWIWRAAVAELDVPSGCPIVRLTAQLKGAILRALSKSCRCETFRALRSPFIIETRGECASGNPDRWRLPPNYSRDIGMHRVVCGTRNGYRFHRRTCDAAEQSPQLNQRVFRPEI